MKEPDPLWITTQSRSWMSDQEILDELIRDEGLKLHVYQDSLGNDTVGVGRLLRRGFRRAEVIYMAKMDIMEAEDDLDRELPYWRQMTPRRQRALLNMCFNLGIGKMMKFKKMLRALWEKDYEAAAREALDSKWAQQVGERAERIAAMLKEG